MFLRRTQEETALRAAAQPRDGMSVREGSNA